MSVACITDFAGITVRADGAYDPGWDRPDARRARRRTVSEANKRVVRRLVDEVLNGGHLELIDELYAPELAWRPGAGSSRSGSASPTSTWRSSS